MGIKGRRRMMRRILGAAIVLAATAAALSGSANVATPHHALADNGVISSHN